MKKLFATLILTLFALASLFHGTHINYDQEVKLSTKQSYMSQYPKIPDLAVYPMTNIPF
jgi:hypothetical protein